MNNYQPKARVILLTALLFTCLLGGSCTIDRDFNNQLRSIAKPYHFNLVAWEFDNIFDVIHKAFEKRSENTEEGVDKVIEYFSTVGRIKSLRREIAAITAGDEQGDLAALEAELNKLERQSMPPSDAVEEVIERQVREVLSQQDIFNPLGKYLKLKVGFPPLNFKLDDPIHLLVISPRDRIESMREILLLQHLAIDDMEDIEAGVDKLDVSSLVVELGGFACYPSFVTNKGDLRFTIDAATEEWLHQYLTFKPLGFRYLLDLIGISRNYEIATINETLVGIVSKEIGVIVYEKYYAQEDNSDNKPEAKGLKFDFDHEMREIRRAVDKYLAQGNIEQAEQFMEQKRQYLAENGYHIRKLNQAYFAFHGAYADKPSSISPIGEELKKLRQQSDSMKDFFETVATMTSRQDLAESIK
ncbi:hypothetical protein ACFLWZ_05295 [Chloroflexota bacterium]